jgi:hypothetical protein
MNTGNVAHPGPYPSSTPYTYEESVWARRGTWTGIFIGAMVGFAISVILASFGAAAGIAAGMGTAAADEYSEPAKGQTAEREPAPAVTTTHQQRNVIKGAGLLSAVWLVVSALAAGLIGGWVAGRVAQVYAADTTILGLITWAVGILMMVVVLSLGAAGTLGGLGAGSGEFMQNRPAPEVDSETGKAAFTAAGLAVWGFFFAQLVGLGATMFGARKGMKRRMRIYPRSSTGYVAP